VSVICQKEFTLEVTAGNAPCSLFEADSTSFGTVTQDGTCPQDPIGLDGFLCTISGLPIGSYEWQFLNGAFSSGPGDFFLTDNVGCSGLTQRVGYQYDDGISQTPPGGNYLDFPYSGTPSYGTLAACEAAYQALNPMGSFPVRDGNNVGIGRQKSCIQSPLNAPPPVFDLVRTLKLSVAQPQQMSLNASTYAAGRFQVTYNGEPSGLIAFTANAATVQGVLNAMAGIIADGGVVCAGTLSAGMTITWNVNGNRSQATAALTTVSIGILAGITTSQQGTGILPEIQVLTVGKYCPDFLDDLGSPEWDGLTLVRDLVATTNLPYWRVTHTLDPAITTLRFQNLVFSNMHVGLNIANATPITAPTAAFLAAGNIDAGTHRWKVSFVNIGTEGGPSPVSNVLVLGIASQVELTNIPIGPAGTTDRIVYRTLASDPNGVFYQVGAVGDNLSTTFIDNVDDATAFNGGFGIPIKPAQCFWQCVIRGNILFAGLGATLWSGIKLDGQTPEGTYILAYPWDIGPFQCPYPASGLTPSVTLTGIF